MDTNELAVLVKPCLVRNIYQHTSEFAFYACVLLFVLLGASLVNKHFLLLCVVFCRSFICILCLCLCNLVRWVLKSLAQMCPRRPQRNIKIIFGDGMFDDSFTTGTSMNAAIVNDSYRLFVSPTAVWKKEFAALML